MIDNRIYKNPFFVAAMAALCCALWGSATPFIKIGYKLFEIVSNDTGTLTLANLTIDGSNGLIDVAQDVDANVVLDNVMIQNSIDTVIKNKGKITINDIVLKNNEFYLTVANNQSQEQFLLIVDMDMSVKSKVEIRKTEARNYFNRVLASDFNFF